MITPSARRWCHAARCGVAHQVALYALRRWWWAFTGCSHGLRASNSLHGVLGRKLAGDGAGARQTPRHPGNCLSLYGFCRDSTAYMQWGPLVLHSHRIESAKKLTHYHRRSSCLQEKQGTSLP